MDDAVGSAVESAHELMTLDELTSRVGMSVRNVRFYTTRGLVPPPIRRGRSGYYSPDHVARLELVQELQAHGFTLAAIERYVSAIPGDATTEDIALHRILLAPWGTELPESMSRRELMQRAGRELTEDELDSLRALGVLKTTERGSYEVAVGHLSVGVSLIDLGFPREAALAAAKVYAEHGRAVAQELTRVFNTMVWPAYRASNITSEQLQQIVERLKPLSIAALVTAYEDAMTEEKRAEIARRANKPK